MSFHREKFYKAKKEHKCLYCGKIITSGEEYLRAIGTIDGEFYDYCLCELCEKMVYEFEDGPYLGELELRDFVECPKCKEWNRISYERIDQAKHIYTCECKECKHVWKINLSEEFEKYLKRKNDD